MLRNKARSSLLLLGAFSILGAMPQAHAATTTYNITETFNQVVYNSKDANWDTIFTGSFSFDPVSKTVSNLSGSLSQAMSGGTTSRDLTFQLSSVYDATLGGLLVTSFYQNSTNVFSGGGFATGGSVKYGNENAYATIFVNVTDPTAALTQNQLDKLAYGDCTPGGLMGKMGKCMTGWTRITNGTPGAGGTMQGTFPITQTITAAVPEPESYAMFMAGLGLLSCLARRRKVT